jgi:hypothetical protein
MRLGLALCKGNGLVFRRSAGLMVRAFSTDYRLGTSALFVDDECELLRCLVFTSVTWFTQVHMVVLLGFTFACIWAGSPVVSAE